MDEQNPRIDAPGALNSVSAGVEDPPEERTREIRAEIEQTREEISETVNAIQDRLRPSTLAANAADSVKRAATDTVREVADSDSVMYIRANPIPMALVGVGIAGLAWLAIRRGNGRTPSRSLRRWPQPRETDDYASGQSFGRGRSEQTAPRAKNQLVRIWNESPLLIGAGSAVLGAIVGYAIPETARERELMGPTRDSLVDTVQHSVRDKVNEVQDAATNAIGLTTSSDSSTQKG